MANRRNNGRTVEWTRAHRLLASAIALTLVFVPLGMIVWHDVTAGPPPGRKLWLLKWAGFALALFVGARATKR